MCFMKGKYIPYVDDVADTTLDEPFKLVGSRYIQVKTGDSIFDETHDILKINITKKYISNHILFYFIFI